MRILIVSTPRSGNTWLRRLLSGALELPDFGIHQPCDLNWTNLPAGCIVQMHWKPGAGVFDLCRRFGFRPILILRHPLDVLISILHFSTFEPATSRWLNGEGGNEESIRRKDPTDPAFAAYACGARASALLSVSPEWLERGIPHIRFEDLVARTAAELGSFLERLSVTPLRPLAEVIEANTLEKSRATAPNQHFWRGQPGIWMELIARDLACRIQQAHARVFASLGYDVDGARDRTPAEIREIWTGMDGGDTRHSSAQHCA